MTTRSISGSSRSPRRVESTMSLNTIVTTLRTPAIRESVSRLSGFRRGPGESVARLLPGDAASSAERRSVFAALLSPEETVSSPWAQASEIRRRLAEALHFPVCVRAGAQVADAVSLEELADGAAVDVGERIVGHPPPHFDAVPGEVGEGALEKVDDGVGALVGVDLGVGEPRVVVDDGVHEVVAHAPVELAGGA